MYLISVCWYRTVGPVLHNREAYRHRLVGLYCLAQMKPIWCVSCKCEKFKKVLDGEVGVDEPSLLEEFIHSYVPGHLLYRHCTLQFFPSFQLHKYLHTEETPQGMLLLCPYIQEYTGGLCF